MSWPVRVGALISWVALSAGSYGAGTMPASADDVVLESPASSYGVVPDQSPCGSYCDQCCCTNTCGGNACCSNSCCGDGCGCCGNHYSRMVCDTWCGTIHESLCGDAKCWRPLSFHSFFSEGWNEAWAGGPAGQYGLTPRHGWLGAFEGLFYRLWLVNTTYQHDLNQPFGGNGYGANFTTFLPFSRRFELYVNAPFVASNGTLDPNRGYRTDFGDLQVAGSFLLSETEAATQLFTLGVTAPTGEAETGGKPHGLEPTLLVLD